MKTILCLWLFVAACADGGVTGPRADTGSADADGDTGAADVGPADAGGTDDAGDPSDAGSDSGGEFDCREGAACNADGDGCTRDVCRGGVCVSEGAVDCDDAVECTVDRCVASSALDFACEHEVDATSCFIDEVCVAAGDPRPDSACEACDPATSSTAWSSAIGASCNDGDACTVSDMCTAEGCVGTSAGDSYEPNETRGSASRLGDVSDGDSFPKATIRPSIFPDTDEDWFVYYDSDDFGGLIFPRATLLMPLGVDLDVCIYVDCESSFVDRTCTDGEPATLGGLQGCCGRNRGFTAENVRVNHNCSGADDSADIYVQVTRVSGSMSCGESYSLGYGDD